MAQMKAHYKIKEDETDAEYVSRMCSYKENDGLTWEEVAQIANTQTDEQHTESWYRKLWKSYNLVIDPAESVEMVEEPVAENEELNPGLDTSFEKRLELKKIKVQLSDERTQANAYIRRLSREDTILEIAKDYAEKMNTKKVLPEPEAIYKIPGEKKAGIAVISDWHYGIEIDNAFNKYNPDIARERVAVLRDEIIARGERNGVSELYVVNLQDLICGRIHLQLRLESRFDVITQIMEVSEILAEFLNDLSQHFHVTYYDSLDNHSRLEPDKKMSMDLESLCRITRWYLKDRVGSYVDIMDNEFGADIVTFNVLGHNIVGVHGDKDKPKTVVDQLSLMTHRHYDLVLTAHLHHFSADEKNESLVVSNGSLMGVDTYAMDLRLTSKPSQNFIVVTEDNPVDTLYRIQLTK